MSIGRLLLLAGVIIATAAGAYIDMARRGKIQRSVVGVGGALCVFMVAMLMALAGAQSVTAVHP